MSFVATVSSVGLLTVIEVGFAACHTYVMNGTKAVAKGSDAYAQILRHVKLPHMVSYQPFGPDDPDVCFHTAEAAHGMTLASAGFGCMLFAQILFLVKIVHTFTAVSFQLTTYSADEIRGEWEAIALSAKQQRQRRDEDATNGSGRGARRRRRRGGDVEDDEDDVAV